MKAVLVREFGSRPSVEDVPKPRAHDDGVVIEVRATGLCRSDWHAWQGHDQDVHLPHVPGHEFAGVISEVGRDVTRWQKGDRVTVPFVCACGQCEQCLSGNQQTCLRQQQPGFHHWGSFAEFVGVRWADENLIHLPAELGFAAAAGLGCRFATAYRGIRQVAQVQPGECVVVFGCGGAGLSAVMIAAAAGARVIAVDTDRSALELAAQHGASAVVVAGSDGREQLTGLIGGVADVAVDAIGAAPVIADALACLRPRGRLVQIGLLPGAVQLDMSALIGRELQWLGSHGMAAHSYPQMLAEIAAGLLDPAALVVREIGLEDVAGALDGMTHGGAVGVTVIRPAR